MKLPGIKPSSAFTEARIHMELSAGVEFYRAVIEAIVVALETGAVVTFNFNGHPVKVDPATVVAPFEAAYNKFFS